MKINQPLDEGKLLFNKFSAAKQMKGVVAVVSLKPVSRVKKLPLIFYPFLESVYQKKHSFLKLVLKDLAVTLVFSPFCTNSVQLSIYRRFQASYEDEVKQ